MKSFPINEQGQVLLTEDFRKEVGLYEIVQDVYLFVGANLPGELGAAIRKYGYDPLNPVPSIIAETKEKCKRERGIAKIVQLGGSYKMGPAKLQRTLSLEGSEITFEEAKAIHRAFWQLYAGVKAYENDYLIPQYDDNAGEGSGWVLNGIGRPIGIYEKYKSDIVNRVVQSTGHDIHVLFVTIVEEVLRRNGIQFKWIIADFHDQSIVEVALKDAEKVKSLLNEDCYVKLNGTIKGQIPLKGDACIVEDLSYAKCSREDISQYLKDIGIIEESDEDQ